MENPVLSKGLTPVSVTLNLDVGVSYEQDACEHTGSMECFRSVDTEGPARTAVSPPPGRQLRSRSRPGVPNPPPPGHTSFLGKKNTFGDILILASVFLTAYNVPGTGTGPGTQPSSPLPDKRAGAEQYLRWPGRRGHVKAAAGGTGANSRTRFCPLAHPPLRRQPRSFPGSRA